jgi:hypothetical protein
MMNNQILSSLFLKLVAKEGFFATAIDGITLMRVDHSTPPLAVLQEPTLVFFYKAVNVVILEMKPMHFSKVNA